jgi:putative membrane protein insertion efficiency factor
LQNIQNLNQILFIVLENRRRDVIVRIVVKFLILLIKVYKISFSFKRPSCMFVPTCSQYAIEAIKKHGPIKGIYLSALRILRCRPSFKKCANFRYDPVPEK